MHECRIHYPRRRLPSPSTEPIAPLTEILRGKGSDIRLWPTDERKVWTKEQMSMILAGQWNDAENDVDENFSDNAYEEAITTARTEINEAVEEGRFDREWDELDQDEQDEARHAVEERDDSDPVKDLLRNTPDQLLRTSLGRPSERLSEPRWASGKGWTTEASRPATTPSPRC
jgi:hypothetical protein